MSDFIHLHVHTHYSLFDGMLQINDVLEKAKQYGMTAIAITDHGNLFGAIDFYRKAKAADIKPIIGCELYVAQGSRFDKHTEVSKEITHHIVVLAENMTG
jgi:DNA polymerase-3 subunit alpha